MPRIQMSPFVHDQLDVAYVAYCNAPHAQRAGFKKPSKAAFKKLYNERHDQAVADYNAKHGIGQTTTTRTKKAKANNADGIGALGLSPDVIEALRELLTPGNTPEPNEDEGDYAERTPRDQVPADAARNAVLWALNTEGFLTLDPEGGNDPITQDEGTELLSEVFGPLPAAR